MINLLTTIFEFIITLINFVINTITSLFNLLISLPAYILFITTNIATLPSILIPFLLASISIYVIMLILGRNS